MKESERVVTLPGGETVPALGQGTWFMGERTQNRKAEIEALQTGLDLGMTLIDTAEMYGNGAAEELIAAALTGYRREDVFIVSKVLPQNATRQDTRKACERSLERLDTDYIDLYLLHWRGSVPLAETLAGFRDLHRSGKIRYFGVSNFDRGDLADWLALPGGDALATNQVLYNLQERGIEWDLLPSCREQGLPVMAYSPLEHPTQHGDSLLKQSTLRSVADRHGATSAQIALAWLLHQPDIIVIPKAARAEHVRDNHAALRIELSESDLADLDQGFPPPTRPTQLAIR